MPKVRGLHLPARPGKMGNTLRNLNCSIILLKTVLLRILYQKRIRSITVANDILTCFRKNRARYNAVKISYGENIKNVHSYEQFGVTSVTQMRWKKLQRMGSLEPFYKIPDCKTGLREKLLQCLCTYNTAVLLSSCLPAWLALHPAFPSQDTVEWIEVLQFIPW